jgi:uncharacterized membrane protein
MSDAAAPAYGLEPLPLRPAKFDAVLYPNRSLSPLGFVILMTAVVLVSIGVGAGFVLIGAWPVTGFLGLDVLLLYIAFRCNYRQGRCAEFIRLGEDGLSVRRVEPNGQMREWRFEPYWVRVHMDDPPRHESQLTLASHGRRLVVGAFLTAGERLEVATALRAALHEHRSLPEPSDAEADAHSKPAFSDCNPAS